MAVHRVFWATSPVRGDPPRVLNHPVHQYPTGLLLTGCGRAVLDSDGWNLGYCDGYAECQALGCLKTGGTARYRAAAAAGARIAGEEE
jgi:hypothetical protein